MNHKLWFITILSHNSYEMTHWLHWLIGWYNLNELLIMTLYSYFYKLQLLERA